MTVEPDLELQGAVVALLRASADLKALIGDPIRLYETVPDAPVFPYCTIGDGQQLDDSVQGYYATRSYFDIHVWSRVSSWEEAKAIRGVLRKLLHQQQASLTLTDNHCADLRYRTTQQLRDPDGISRHLIVNFHARLEPIA